MASRKKAEVLEICPTCHLPIDREAKPKKAKPKMSSDELHAFQALLDHYGKSYMAAAGVKPIINAATGKAAKDMLKDMAIEEAIDCVTAAFEDDWFRNNSRELYHIVRNANKYRRPIKPQPKLFVSSNSAVEIRVPIGHDPVEHRPSRADTKEVFAAFGFGKDD
jgi:hypothetical protein